MQVQSLSREDPLEVSVATTPAFFPGEFHGQRSLVGYSWTRLKRLSTQGLPGLPGQACFLG